MAVASIFSFSIPPLGKSHFPFLKWIKNLTFFYYKPIHRQLW
jgi:hypothetical protein